MTSGYTGTPRMRTEDVSDDSRKRRDDEDDEEWLWKNSKIKYYLVNKKSKRKTFLTYYKGGPWK